MTMEPIDRDQDKVLIVLWYFYWSHCYQFIKKSTLVDLPIGRNFAGFLKAPTVRGGQMRDWGWDRGWWQVTLRTECASSSGLVSTFHSDAGPHHHTSYLVCIPYHTSFNLIKPWGCSENGDSGSRGSVREWAAWVSSGNCSCLLLASCADGDRKVCREKLLGTRVLGRKQ